MPRVGLALPLLPGRTELDRRAMESCWRGQRREAYEDARRRAGVTRETAWLQAGPRGDLVVIYLEADDLDAAFGVIGGSQAPFDSWFREHVREVHGLSLSDGLSLPELILDYDGEA